MPGNLLNNFWLLNNYSVDAYLVCTNGKKATDMISSSYSAAYSEWHKAFISEIVDEFVIRISFPRRCSYIEKH